MSGRLSRVVQKHACRLASEISFASTQEHLREMPGVRVCAETIRSGFPPRRWCSAEAGGHVRSGWGCGRGLRCRCWGTGCRGSGSRCNAVRPVAGRPWTCTTPASGSARVPKRSSARTPRRSRPRSSVDGACWWPRDEAASAGGVGNCNRSRNQPNSSDASGPHGNCWRTSLRTRVGWTMRNTCWKADRSAAACASGTPASGTRTGTGKLDPPGNPDVPEVSLR